jgi:uncharacterized membrane protein YkvA (DUF1232 family)
MNEKPENKIGVLKALFKSIIDPRTSWVSKLLPIIVLLYVIIPVDVLPDFIPFAGLLDDLIITPLGLWLAIKMIPESVLNDNSKELNETVKKIQNTFLWVAVLIAVFTVVVLGGIVFVLIKIFGS